MTKMTKPSTYNSWEYIAAHSLLLSPVGRLQCLQVADKRALGSSHQQWQPSCMESLPVQSSAGNERPKEM